MSLAGVGNRVTPTQIFTAIDSAAEEYGTKVLIVFDEIQRATGFIGSAIQSSIAYAYDHLKNISFILSGSEMGVVYRFPKEPEAPLYGRAYLEVRTRRLSRYEFTDFLKRGFNELNYRISREEVEEAIDRPGGIIGWLTYYGYTRAF